MDTKEQAMYLMSSTAMGTVELAQTLGVSPALISQYKADPEFMALVEQRRTTVGLAQIRRDEKIDALEDKALERLETVMGMTFKPMEVLRIAQVLNGMERRSQSKEVLPKDSGGGAQVVSIVLPRGVKEATVQVKMNTNNEIVEVAGRQMINMGTAEIMSELEKHKEAPKAQHLGKAQEVGEGELVQDETYADDFAAHLQLMQSF